MRPFFVAIVVIAIGYLGWVLFHSSKQPAAPEIASGAGTPMPASTTPATPGPRTAADRAVVRPPSAPRSLTARPGYFYALDRVTKKTETGVKALNPGDEVQLMYRYKDGSMLVTNGLDEFVVPASAVTPDPARAAALAPR